MNVKRNRDSYNDTYGDAASQRGRTSFDLLLNWILLIGVIGIGISQLERDWYTYKMELTFYHTVQDGMTPTDMESGFMARGVERNMEYLGQPVNKFFRDQWMSKLPFYLGGLLIPFLIGIIRLTRKGYRRWNTPYFIAWAAFIFVAAYSLLDRFGALA